MWNIMRAQAYQLKRDILTIGAIVLLCGLHFCISFIQLADRDGLNGGLSLVVTGEMSFVFCLYLLIVIVPRVCAWDFNDRTINYEVLSGHKRAESFIGRILVAYGLAFSLTALLVGCPIIYGIIKGGWGSNVSLGDTALRILLLAVGVLRFTAELILVSFLFRNSVLASVLGIICIEALSMPFMLIQDGAYSFMSSLDCISDALIFNNNIMGFENGKDITIFLTEFPSYYIPGAVISGLVVTTLCLVGAYMFFRKVDLR